MLSALKATRRRFFGLIGVTPLAAKAAADAQIARLSGMPSGTHTGLGAQGVSVDYGYGNPSTVPGDGMSWSQRVAGCVRHIEMFGLPRHVQFRLREQSKYVGWLDPDIACKRSWSMSVKLMTQRQRNYERYIARFHAEGEAAQDREMLRRVLGFEWPW
jgi:hypothetical protein